MVSAKKKEEAYKRRFVLLARARAPIGGPTHSERRRHATRLGGRRPMRAICYAAGRRRHNCANSRSRRLVVRRSSRRLASFPAMSAAFFVLVAHIRATVSSDGGKG